MFFLGIRGCLFILFLSEVKRKKTFDRNIEHAMYTGKMVTLFTCTSQKKQE